jgi:acyl-CoA dehydrogenase
MDFTFTKEQEMIRKDIREFSKNEITSRLQEIDEKGAIPNDVIKSMAKINILCMSVDKRYGGLNADPITVGIVAEELARADISCAIPTFFLVQEAWGSILDRYGTQEAKQAILPDASKGEAFLGIAATEPEAGSDLVGISTTAKKIGDGYILNGGKLFISGVREVMSQMPKGGGYVTLAKTSPKKGAKGMSLFFLPLSKAEGVTTTSFDDWGRRGISAGGFMLSDVKIPHEFLIGTEDRGFYITMEGFDYARAIIAVVCCGAATTAMERAMDYIKERKAFGWPIGKYGTVQMRLAEHWSKIQSVRLLAYEALWTVEKELERRGASRFETTMKCAQAKLLAPQYAFEAINDSIQFFGAFGYTTGCDLALALKGVRSYYWAEGTREIMAMIVGRELLGKEFVAYR